MKGSSILEVLVVFLLTRLGFSALFFYTGFNTYGFSQFIVPLLVILLARRDFGEYGFTKRNWPESTDVGILAYLITMIYVGVLMVLLVTGIGYQDILGGSILAGASLVGTAVLLHLLQKRDMKTAASPPVPPDVVAARRRSLGYKNLVTIAVLLAFPILLALAVRLPPARLGEVASWEAWQFVVSGFGEETLYRGYVQSRVNAEYGRPWSVKGVQFGPGLFVAAALFGFTHVLNPFDPFNGIFTLAWGWGIATFAGGIFFGLIREKTGDLIGPGIAHGLPDAVGESIYLIFAGTYV